MGKTYRAESCRNESCRKDGGVTKEPRLKLKFNGMECLGERLNKLNISLCVRMAGLVSAKVGGGRFE